MEIPLTENEFSLLVGLSLCHDSINDFLLFFSGFSRTLTSFSSFWKFHSFICKSSLFSHLYN